MHPIIFNMQIQPAISKRCKICGNLSGNIEYTVREMMFGFKDEFRYIECSTCGCLQIACFPENIDKYYPAEYYAFKTPIAQNQNKIRSFFSRLAFQLYFKGIKWFVNDKIPVWLKNINISLNAPILDVGCGSGKLLFDMRQWGFSNLTGIDPYISQDFFCGKEVRIFKKNIEEAEGTYDLIMLHHSFEHFADPKNALPVLYKLLKRGGQLIIRIPVVPCLAWEDYGVNWIQLDAPRHFYLHSVKSMDLLCQSANLKIHDIMYDSTIFQFWGSELYKRGIPYKDAKMNGSIFKHEQLVAFDKKAKELNKIQRGDQACFYLKRKIDLTNFR